MSVPNRTKLPPPRLVTSTELHELPGWAKPPSWPGRAPLEVRAATGTERRRWAQRVRELMRESPLRDLASAGLQARYELVELRRQTRRPKRTKPTKEVS